LDEVKIKDLDSELKASILNNLGHIQDRLCSYCHLT